MIEGLEIQRIEIFSITLQTGETVVWNVTKLNEAARAGAFGVVRYAPTSDLPPSDWSMWGPADRAKVPGRKLGRRFQFGGWPMNMLPAYHKPSLAMKYVAKILQEYTNLDGIPSEHSNWLIRESTVGTFFNRWDISTTHQLPTIVKETIKAIICTYTNRVSVTFSFVKERSSKSCG